MGRQIVSSIVSFTLSLSVFSTISAYIAPSASALTLRATNSNALCDQNVGTTASVTAERVSNSCVVTFLSTSQSATTTNSWIAPTGVSAIEILIVGGGGGGGVEWAGGGGAGSVIFGSSFSVSGGTSYSLQVGRGGSGSTSRATRASQGTQSSFGSWVASGGGGGAGSGWSSTFYAQGGNGGSGGGAAEDNGVIPGGLFVQTTYSGAQVFGNRGGNNSSNSGSQAGAGGGGAGTSGSGIGGDVIPRVGETRYPGKGGSGITIAIGGKSFAVAGGGGGSSSNSRGLGGDGLGGNGGQNTAGSDALANTGSGGGGGQITRGGAGAAGIVVIAYTIPSDLPSAPSSVSVSAAGAGLNVSWSAPINEAGRTRTAYQVEHSTNGINGWTTASSSVSAAALTFQITGLVANTSYYVRVAARYSSGEIGAYGYPWVKVYGTTTPTRNVNSIVYENGFGLNGTGAAAPSNTSFSRVRYLMKSTYSAQANYVDADFFKSISNSPTDLNSVANLQVPSLSTSSPSSRFVVQGNVSDLTVLSNVSTQLRNGFGYSGRLELWPWNYGTGQSGSLTARDTSVYDDSDTPNGDGSYGSFQLHSVDPGYKKNIFSWNNHGATPEIGFGDFTGTHPDWTFCAGSCTGRTNFSLEIFINSPTTTLAGPTINSLSVVSGATTGGTTTVITGTNLTGTSSVTVGGVAASLGGITSTTVSITTPVGTVGAKDVVLTTPAGSVTRTGAFTYTRANQATITIATRFGTSGFPLVLAIQGGSGTGTLTYTLDPLVQSSCLLAGSMLTPNFIPSTSGICYVKAVRAQDQTFSESSSATTAIFFTAYVPVVEQAMTCPVGTTPSAPTGIGVTTCTQVLAPVSPTAGDSGAAPKITGLSATSGLVGATITITGTGFSTVTRVQFGTKSTTTFTATATTITVNVPEGATRGRVMVISPTGTAMAAQIFTVTVPEAPAP